MNKDEMLRCLEEALRYVLCRELTGEDKKSMEASISLFIREDAARFSEEELLDKFNTPDQSVALFVDYLETWGPFLESGNGSLH